MSARAINSRRRIPPDSRFGFVFAFAVRSNTSSSSFARRIASSFGSPK
jgi:hypothetical protein